MILSQNILDILFGQRIEVQDGERAAGQLAEVVPIVFAQASRPSDTTTGTADSPDSSALPGCGRGISGRPQCRPSLRPSRRETAWRRATQDCRRKRGSHVPIGGSRFSASDSVLKAVVLPAPGSPMRT